MDTEKKTRGEELTHACVRDGWFYETDSVLWPGQRFALEVEQILHVEKSGYQDILVFLSSTYGVVLVLDGVIQVTQRDECAYHEMMACVPLACRSPSKPAKRALVIGGGDGGVVRELLRACTSLVHIDLVEIDAAVVSVATQYMPEVAACVNDARVRLHVDVDGRDYLRDHVANGCEKYDVIVSDSTDPVGVGESLFSSDFYGLVKEALCPDDGVLCSLGECSWLHDKLIKRNLGILRSHFSSAMYAAYSQPTYPCGTMGMLVACVSSANRPNMASTQIKGNKYYSSALHCAAFCLPKFLDEYLNESAQNDS